jgi:hypothetical protein
MRLLTARAFGPFSGRREDGRMHRFGQQPMTDRRGGPLECDSEAMWRWSDGSESPATDACPMMGSQAAPAARPAIRTPILWGIVVGLLQAATPVVFWWLNMATVYGVGLVLIAAIYVGFAVADGRPKIVAVESSVTFAFVVVAASAITESPWLLAAGLFGHGLKDLWQHRTHFVANTRWWPPFCMVVDWVVAAIIVGEIAVGADFT